MLTLLLCQHATVGLHIWEQHPNGPQLQPTRRSHGRQGIPWERTCQDAFRLQAREPVEECKGGRRFVTDEPAERLKGQSGELPDGPDADLHHHGFLRPHLGPEGTFIHTVARSVQACGRPWQHGDGGNGSSDSGRRL